MPKVDIELNPKKAIVWDLPGTSVYLTMKNPKGSVELDQLNDYQRNALINAVRLHKIDSSLDAEELFRSDQERKEKEKEQLSGQLKEEAEVKKEEKRVLPTQAELLSKAIKILKHNLPTVEKEIHNNKDNVRFLKVLLEAEKARKNRKKVVSQISERIEEFEGQVSESVKASLGGGNVNFNDPSVIRHKGQMIRYEVEHEEVEPDEQEQIDIQSKVNEYKRQQQTK